MARRTEGEVHPMSRYVFVHGSWHGAWCWEKVEPLLKEKGHEVLIFDLQGHGTDKTAVDDCTLEAYVKLARDVLVSGSDEPSILVGHSFGGVVISEVAEYEPQRVKRLVFLAAFMPGNGESLKTWADQDAESLIGPNLVVHPDTTATLKEEALKDIFYGDCSDEDIKWAIEHLVPEPLIPTATPVSLTNQNYGQVERIYIQTQKDQAITPAIQEQMVKANPCEVMTLETSHSPWLSAPEHLCEHLLKLA
jgi:pimeloyl-ACP methyl ester carboxylesterase